MTTIKDVAKLAKVSPAIVSRVINKDNTLSIRKETEERVIWAVEQLGFRPNMMARALRIKETKVIAMVIADITNPYFAELVKGAQKAAIEKDFVLTLFDTEEDIEQERRFINVISDRQMDGIILTSLFIGDKTGEIIDDLHIPYVLVHRSAHNSDCMYVSVDDIKGASLAVQHLIDGGHKKIGTISGLHYTNPGLLRLEGYKKTLKSNGIMISQELIAEADFSEAGGYKAMEKLLAQNEAPTAVFVANDLMALGAMEAIKDSGRKIPEDIAIVGFDDIWFSRITSPALTTVKANLMGMGYTACSILIKTIQGESISEENIIIDVELVVRASSAAE